MISFGWSDTIWQTPVSTWRPLLPTSRKYSNWSPASVSSLNLLLDTSTWIPHRQPEITQPKLNPLQTCSLLVNRTFSSSFFKAGIWEIALHSLPLCPGSAGSLFPHRVYSSYPSSAAAIIFVIFKLNDMISLSEMLLWLSTALRWESRSLCRMHQTLHGWAAASCLVIIPWHTRGPQMLTSWLGTQGPGLSSFPVTSEPLIPCSLWHKWFPLFYPHDKRFLVFKAHLRVSFLFSRLFLAGLSVFLRRSWNTSFKAFVEVYAVA